MTIALNLPAHLYGYIDRRFVSAGDQDGFEPAVLFGLTCPANRAFGLTVMLEGGGIYRELPPHAWSFVPDPVEHWPLEAAQRWNCFGGDAQALAYDYLRHLACFVLPGGYAGEYLFSVECANDGFSNYPGQSKTFHFLELENGRLTIQPGNFIAWHDASFTKGDGPPSWLRRQETIWSVEEGQPWWAK